MCGIIGSFNNEDARKIVAKGLNILKNRGVDGFGISSENDYSNLSTRIKSYKNVIGHRLHSIVNTVKQPFFEKDKKFIANCEIYNWEELAKKHKIKAENDAELLFKLLLKYLDDVNEALKQLDGVYAFALWDNERAIFARDLIGVKPLWYSHSHGFSFASEKKALTASGFLDIAELNPRQIMIYDIFNDKLEFKQREFFDVKPVLNDSLTKIKHTVTNLLEEAIKKRVPEQKIGLLFSGGLDSVMIALIMKRKGIDFTCYTAAVDEEAEDLIYAKKSAELLGFNLKTKVISLEECEEYLKQVVPLIETSNVTKVGVALTFHVACAMAQKDKVKVIFSGLGSEEIFAGYERHRKSQDVNQECISGLRFLYERDTYRDDIITMNSNLELRVPFLDKKLIAYALRIPSQYKIKNGVEKWILREIALGYGLDKELANRKKKAAQYGSKFDKAISKLSKKHGFKYKSDYLRSIYPEHNLRLGALFSSGKDSSYALYVMQKRNYSVNCLITLKSKNQDSYMYHTPNIHLTKLQAKAMSIPIITQITLGEKEEELKDLRIALEKAKKKYKIDGIVTGALFSNYQRERIEKVCDEAGLKVFAPLWHKNQESAMREIINEGFEFIFSSIAADGLDKHWLGRIITEEDVNELVKLNKKNGLNIAGEGGEFESLVLNAPFFKSKLFIKSSEIKMFSENTGRFIIKKAKLVKKK
ncbi:MAG: diphthine--ammonia ligase [Nanoarchaeota archaeon]|nr:diphthine--ammonia ligase [Nanoarchaeota archaeon]